MKAIATISPALLLTVSLTGIIAAQNQTIAPPSATSQLGGSTLGFPFSYTGYTRYQQAIDSTYVKTGLIYGISFRSRTNVAAVKERQWQEMRVILADLTATAPSGMGTSYDGNLGTNKDEVFSGRFNIYRPNPSDDLEFSVTIPFDKPFLYVGTAPLVVDLMPNGQGYEQWPGCGSGGNGTAMDASRDTGLYSMYGKGTCGTGPTTGTPGAGGFVIQFYWAPMLMPFGKGCPGSNNQIPQIGSTGSATLGSNFAFTMSGAPASSSSSVLVVGLSNEADGAIRLPADLGLATPGSGCWQNTEALLVFFLPVAAGQSALPVVIPNNPTIKGLPIFSQFAVDDPTLGGFTVTQGGVTRPQ